MGESGKRWVSYGVHSLSRYGIIIPPSASFPFSFLMSVSMVHSSPSAAFPYPSPSSTPCIEHLSNRSKPPQTGRLVVFEGLEPFEHAARNVFESSKPSQTGVICRVWNRSKAFEHAQRPEIGLKSPSRTLSNLFERLEPNQTQHAKCVRRFGTLSNTQP